MLPEETARFSLSELVDASGMPERTVRFYIDQGLIPPALGKGRSRYYTPEHLQLLEQVKTLREQKLSIEEVRQRLHAQQASEALPAQHWERIVLHPDLEIMVRTDAPEGVRALAQRIVQLSGEWFGENDGLSSWDQDSR